MLAVAAHHVAARHQDHGWAVLVADGTRHAGATRRCGHRLRGGGGRIVSRPLGNHACLGAMVVAKITNCSIVKAQLCQNALELLLQEVITNTPGLQLFRTTNRHLAGKLPPIFFSFAVSDELLLDLCHPKLQQSLHLSVICLLQIDSLPGNLLTKRHDQHRRSQDAVYPQVYLPAGGTQYFPKNAANANPQLKLKTRFRNPQSPISIIYMTSETKPLSADSFAQMAKWLRTVSPGSERGCQLANMSVKTQNAKYCSMHHNAPASSCLDMLGACVDFFGVGLYRHNCISLGEVTKSLV